MIYFFTPYDKRGLGFAYNEHCALVPNPEDIIVLMDSDIMLFPSHWGKQIEEVVNNYPQFSLFTCLATRTYKTSEQQYAPELRSERDLVKLKNAADRVAAKRYGQCQELRSGVSGFLMAFRKKLWDEFKFPTTGCNGERNLGIETEWVRNIREHGHKVGLMTGLLAIHYYRLGTGDKDKSHLR